MTAELEQFDNEFTPAPPTATSGPEDLTDGEYLFEVAEARLKKPKGNNILEMALLVLTPGKHEGATIQYATFINNHESAARVGRDLRTLGFDTDEWKKPNGRPFSAEIDKAIKLLPGLRWKGVKKTNKNGEKTFHNIYINERVLTDGKPQHFGPAELNGTADPNDPF
jgi:hypothetical protein